jgi:hypothetical protein
MSKEKLHPFLRLTQLVEEYDENKESYDVNKLQLLREELSINLFYMSDSASIALSNYDFAEHARKTKTAEREQFYHTQIGSNGKSMTVAEAANLARIDCKEEVEKCKETLRQKKRVEITLSAVSQILNALSTRISIVR